MKEFAPIGTNFYARSGEGVGGGAYKCTLVRTSHFLLLSSSLQLLLQYLMPGLKLATQFRHAFGMCIREAEC